MTQRIPGRRLILRSAGAVLHAARVALAPTRSIPFGLAIALIGSGYLYDRSSAQRVAPTRLPTIALERPAQQGAFCPLSVGQQVKAVDAFTSMMPVFRHARCSNCHGGIDVRDENQHRGADQVEGDPMALLTIPERTEFSKQCVDCHDGLPGWMVPGPGMRWASKNNEQLCTVLKLRPHHTGALFVDHIARDHGEIQFIAAGFVGDRALGAERMADYGVRAEAPPGTQAQLTAMAQRWVTLQGGDWVGSPECGCVKPDIELIMKSEVTGESQGETITAEMSATVKLTPDTSGLSYRGEALLVHGAYRTPAMPGCSVQHNPTGGTFAVKEAIFDATEDGQTTVRLTVNTTNSGGTSVATCQGFPIPLSIPTIGVSQQWRFVHQPDLVGADYRFNDFEIPASTPLGGERTLVARKQLTREQLQAGVKVTAKTTFEFWAVLRRVS